MSKKIKIIKNKQSYRYVCDKCGHIEKFSKIGFIFERIIIPLFVGFGSAFITLIIIMSIQLGPGGAYRYYSGTFLNSQALVVNEDMRELGLKMAPHCSSDEFCYVITIYKNLSREIHYAYSTKYQEPEYTWRTKYGDCKAMSALYTNILTNLGINSYVDGNIKYKHAVSIVMPRDSDYYYMVDLTTPKIEQYKIGVNHWDFIYQNEENNVSSQIN